MLIIIAIVAIIALLLVPAFQSIRNRSSIAKCMSNLRQLGIAARAFAAENNNEWPYAGDYNWPDNQGAWTTGLIRDGGKWYGLGKTFPYHQNKFLHFCPEDKTPNVKNTLHGASKDWRVNGSGSLNGSYLIRGYGQVYPRPLPRTYFALDRISIASCFFTYCKRNPENYPLSHHSGTYPVLFSDGSVEVFKLPQGSIDPQNPPEIWDDNIKQIKIWEYFDGKRININ